jgi:hypothetical protein
MSDPIYPSGGDDLLTWTSGADNFVEGDLQPVVDRHDASLGAVVRATPRPALTPSNAADPGFQGQPAVMRL